MVRTKKPFRITKRLFALEDSVLPTRVLLEIRIKRQFLCRYGIEIHFVIPGASGDAWIDPDIVVGIDDDAGDVIGVFCAIGWGQMNTEDSLGVIDEGPGMPAVKVVEAEAVGGELDPSFPSYFIQEDG